ncbi:MAG TPA: XdhC family protein [Jatrophihabitans sp.]|jgi:xanthine dehydrogenase accessory factor
MYDIAGQVAQWLAGGQAVHVAQVVATQGFSSRDPAAALAWTDDGRHFGALLPHVDAMLIESGAELDGHLAELAVTDADAVAAGLSCGGTATVLVQSAAAYPPEIWQRLLQHEPLCLVSEIVADAPGATTLYTPQNVRDAAQHPGTTDVPRLFARGMSATALSAEGDTSIAVVTLWPTTQLIVVGSGLIATALADAAMLLGWTSTVTEDVAEATERAARLTGADAVVVLSHDRDTDVPALAAMLTGQVGYVGALGSRATQAARREGLLSRGLDDRVLARIHGPAGLDIEAHTPAEIAVSIVAEIIASRSGSSGGSISGRGGPVHTGGVHAPPPRH